MPLPRLSVLLPVVAAALPVAALAALYGVSEWRLRDFAEPPEFAAAIPADVASIAHGEHVARTRGCHSCHGANLEGKDWSAEWPGMGRVIAVNLARLAREESPATLARAIRHGIGRDGRALYSMPAYNFTHLRDADLAALLAYLRAHPVLGDSLGRPHHSLQVRWDLAMGGGTHIPEWVAQLPPLQADAARDGAPVAEGEYLAMTSCNECHGLDLRGTRAWGDTTPDLAIVAGYSREEFGRLMRDGIARDGRDDLRLMSRTARARFVHWTPAEVDALYAFLRTLPGRPIATGVFWREGT